MSWESSIAYERIINEEVRSHLGGVHSADLHIRSYDFAVVEGLQASGDWEAAGRLLASGAADLERSGAELILLCTNTMHMVSDAIERAIDVPFLHLADATAQWVVADGLHTVGLLGTRYTMEGSFYTNRLASKGISAIVPDLAGREAVHNVIYEELVRGIIDEQSQRRYLEIVDELTERGAEGIVAGCTEIELLLAGDDLSVPYYPTTTIHAVTAARWALGLADLPS